MEELRNRLNSVADQLTALEKDLAGHFARMAEREIRLGEDLERISKTLFGNGRTGLHTQVQLMSHQLATAKIADHEQTRGKWLAISAGITSGVTLIVTLLHIWLAK